ncbi:carboxylate--amine ligase [Marinobacter adhaerens]|uniref:carboxylate--amine ligase n=1 Tax=Marinobacter adhaerens TaxID=1033846 RepID=UPI001C5698D1|nr:ATP-grasp domain-containing protein [Marinobacter adhaerens]MBW3225630.1 ATP-grasp domain-containing protein [Marinobacter adhaerens]
MEHRILVFDGNQRASLAAVRSLGSKSLWVAVGETKIDSLAGSSRFCSRQIMYSDPFQSPRDFFDDTLLQIENLGITFLLPITEATTYVLLKYRAELPETVILPFPDTSIVEKVANKNELFSLALAQGVPVPETIVCHNIQEGRKALELHDSFPLVLKPYKSKILLDQTIVSTQVIIAKSKDEAITALATHEFFDFPFTLQTYVKGQGQGIFALFDRGRPVCFFAHRRIREKPPGGGVSVLSESAPIDEKLKISAEKLLRHVQWHGVAMVEFRVTDDGIGYLMEINPRFWGSLQLAIDSGVDFPWLLYLVSTGQEIPAVRWHHRRLRWLLGDLDRLYLVLQAPLSTYSLKEKIFDTLRFFVPGFHTRHEVNRWEDPGPFWFELKQYLRAIKD